MELQVELTIQSCKSFINKKSANYTVTEDMQQPFEISTIGIENFSTILLQMGEQAKKFITKKETQINVDDYDLELIFCFLWKLQNDKILKIIKQ